MLSVEVCKYCRGTGWLGMIGQSRLLCQWCGGLKQVFVDRASIYDDQKKVRT